MTIEEKIKRVCEIQGVSLTELGKRLGISQPTISKRLKVGKFTQEELREIGRVLGCRYYSYFVFPDGRRV